MGTCSCVIEFDDVYYSEDDYHIAKILLAHKPLQCEECGAVIELREKYEYVVIKHEGKHSRISTCFPCREVRDCYCCSWQYGSVWEAISEEIRDIDLSALETLSPKARKKFFAEIHNNT